jgi:hypothetical protein
LVVRFCLFFAEAVATIHLILTIPRPHNGL